MIDTSSHSIQLSTLRFS